MKNIPILWFLRHHASLSSQCTVAWIQYLGLSDILSTTTRPKKKFYSSIHRMFRHFSLDQWMCSLANFIRFCTCQFFNNGAYRTFLLNSLASIFWLAALTVNFRSLTFLEGMIGWIFAILTILWYVLTVVARFLQRVSGFHCHFKAFGIILAEHPIICCIFIRFPLSNQLFNEITLFLQTNAYRV